MSDEEIKAVLRRAAEDRAFFEALMENRASALDAFELSPAEKAILIAPTRVQLRKMVDEVRRKPFLRPGRIAAYAGIGAAAALGFGFFATLTATAGVSREIPYEYRAQSALTQIAFAERLYRQEHGAYCDLDGLIKAGLLTREWAAAMVVRHPVYEFDIKLDRDSFTATARHRTRPDTRRAFQVGPDGEVRPLE